MAQLVSIQGLSVAFNGVPVLRGVDLALSKGEALGLVGESGSGKSVTWLAALGLLPRQAKVSGSVRLDGREILGAPAVRARPGAGRAGRHDLPGSGERAQSGADHPQAALRSACALHRDLSGEAVKAEALRLLDLVGIPDAARRLSAYPHEFSGGQVQRIMIAMALAGNPDLLIADEPTTALDATIQAQILELLSTIRREMSMAMVLISHDLGVVAENCDRVAVMYAGRIVEQAPANQLFADPVHPYAQGLIGALPPLDGPRRRLTAIPGTVPDPAHMPMDAPSRHAVCWRPSRAASPRRRLRPSQTIALSPASAPKPRAARCSGSPPNERAARRGVLDLAQLFHALRDVRPQHGRACRRRRVAENSQGRNARPRRRVRLGQIHDGAHRARPRAAGSRRGAVRRQADGRAGDTGAGVHSAPACR